jgi:RES domain-containing protein
VIVAWRFVKEKHVGDAFDGEGARLYGGRWNSRGVPVVYTGGSLSLSVLEQFVHLRAGDVRIRFAYMRVRIPDKVAVEEIIPSQLPRDWREGPAPDSTKEAGTHWFEEGRTAILRVPSVVIPVEYNYILNPGHPDFKHVDIGAPEPLSFDPRMWK